MDRSKIQSAIQDLEIKKGIKMKELEEVNKSLEQLKKRALDVFGTTDILELRKIQDNLSVELENSVAELREKGVEI